uniref:Insect cuticle domain protein n=1 Tax=Parasacculina yatsui TaxID=2836420 RepID=A0A386AVR7_9CRUS|nr:insect cuticle domain protein [Parasacculina yatsui]
MKLILLSLAVVGCGCWKLPAIPSGQRSQYYTQQSDGSYKFGFDSTQGLYHVQQADGANEVQGSFGGAGDRIQYTAGVDGFRVFSTDHEPSSGVQQVYHHEHQGQQQEQEQVQEQEEEEQVANDATVEVSVAAAQLPQQVEDTAEVAEAKRRFHIAYSMAAQAAQDAPDTDIINSESSSMLNHNQHQQVYFSAGGHQASSSSSAHATIDQLLTHPVQVEDTEAVSIAKAKFHQAYAAAAQAAADAPDTDIITADSSNSQSQAASEHHISASTGHHKYSMVNIANNNIEEATMEHLLTHPVQVEDTAEVAHAKKEFHKAFQAAAQAAAAAPDTNIITVEVTQQDDQANDEQAAVAVASSSSSDASGEQHSSSASVQQATLDQLLTLPIQVEDTAEVARAKVEFQKAYDAAAAAAEAAPDTDVIAAETSQVSHSDATSAAHVSKAAIAAASSEAAANVQVQHATMEQLLTHPVQVEDTEEVAKAKAEFFRLYAAAAAAADAAPDVNIVMKVSTPIVQAAMNANSAVSAMSHLHSMNTRPNIRFATLEELLTLPKPVEDTDEVKRAKIAFHAAYKAAAAAAEEAEDISVVSDSANTQEQETPESNSVYHMDSSLMTHDEMAHTQSDSGLSSNDASQILSLTSNHMDDGSYQFAYETEDSSRQEMADSMNNVQGSYSYIGNDQRKRVVNYKAGADIGFVVSGDHLPQQVEDAADVEAAKAAFKAAYEAALANSGQSGQSSASVATSYGAPVAASISFMPVHTMTASTGDNSDKAESVEMSHQMNMIPVPLAAVPVHHTLHHVQHAGDDGVITYSLQDGVVVMQADGFSSPQKFGYTFN